MKAEIFDAVLAARQSKTPLAVVTRLADGAQSLVYDDRTDLDEIGLDTSTADAVRDRIRDDASGTMADGTLFVHVHAPALRMIIVGAVHIAQALAPMATIAGYAVTIVDPRASFASEERFPGVALSDDWPDEAMEALAPDSKTAVVTLTHDPKLDDPALHVALKSSAFYIACLGSRRTHAGRMERLREAGFDEPTLSRIHGPAGLPIGAVSPAEIALSVMAELTAVKHGKPALVAAA